MKKKFIGKLLSAVAIVTMLMPAARVSAGATLYNNATGNEDGYDYELWKDYGNTSMTLNGGGKFSCQWSNIGNALFRKGVKFDSTKTYQQIGGITFDYGCEYYPSGNSYLCVYGWTKDPLIEYYIVDSWGSWRPPGGTPKGQIYVDGGTYDVYETTRYNQPSIIGDTTFQQYFSVRTEKRTSGKISVAEHFKAWESMGMRVGKLYEAALNIEGYQSSGQANVYKNDLTIGGSISSGNNGGGNGGNGNSNAGNNLVTVDSADKLQCEDMKTAGQYTGKVSSPFSGVALYGNNDCVTFTQNFTKGTHDFTLRGCSNNDNMAKVDLVIGNQTKGTFYFGDSNPAEYTIKNVSHGTGNQEVKLIVTADDGQWDAYIDWLGIGGIASEGGNTGGNGGNNGGNGGNNGGNNSGNTGNNLVTVDSADKLQCENMKTAGQYTGKVSSPFSGVALYGNNDCVTFTQNFTKGTHDFTLRGCSNNDNMAKVDLVIGNQTKGTFYFGDSNPAEYTIKNVSHGTGNQEVKLIVTADDGQWDAYIDWLGIGGIANEGGNTGGNGGNTGGNGGNNGGNGGNTGNTGNTGNNGGSGQSGSAAVSGTTVQCENMTKSGQYTGNVSSPFSGVALYANKDSVSFTQNFNGGTHNFTLRGCSNNSSMARVDLVIGGQTKGTFYYGDANPAEFTIENVSVGSGNQKVELVVTADNGQWDAYLDWLRIDGVSSSGNGQNTGSQQSGQNTGSQQINKNTKLVALTFDDGPSSTTSQVLDVLERYGVPATFFLIGQNVNSDTRAIMERQVSMGCELACHSYTHEDMSYMSAQDIRNQIEWTRSAIKNTVGYDINFFRPPYIATSNTMYQNIDYPFIQGIMCNDWESGTSSYQRSSTVLNSVTDGSIILLHDFQGNSQTVDALPAIIEGLQSRGYTLVTVSDLFKYKGINPDVEYKIWTTVQ